MSDDKLTALLANRTAELQAALQKHIDALNMGQVDTAGMYMSLYVEYSEIMARYNEALADLDYEQPTDN